MPGKYSVIRSESRLANVDPKIQKLFNEKHVRIVKAQEQAEEQAEETQAGLIEALVELSMKNSDDLKSLAGKINVKIKTQDAPEEIKEKITKSLESQGFDVGLVYKGRRQKVVE